MTARNAFMILDDYAKCTCDINSFVMIRLRKSKFSNLNGDVTGIDLIT